ncbi:hypothetical protein [Streptomyces sp. NPDC088261]|uniref:arsenate reductase/protein-tyrosine-phosphatase family protein n=1 Tax=Streptomyces sp. NPDC088261 TaxID=3365851 RepID=UPI0037F4953E
MPSPYRVCFVRTGNICRSPVAASVFRARLAEAGLDTLVEVDSAGTGGGQEGDGDLDVADPYDGDLAGFEECLESVEAASEGLLSTVRTAVEEAA